MSPPREPDPGAAPPRRGALERWLVWSADFTDETQANRVLAAAPLGAALVFVSVELARDELVLAELDADAPRVEDLLVEDRAGGRRRYRVTVEPGLAVQLEALRACRVCGCTDDRAGADGCGWAGPDLCDACLTPAPNPEPEPETLK